MSRRHDRPRVGVGRAASLVCLIAAMGCAQETGDVGARTEPLVTPPEIANGVSDIEGRYTYADPDEGEFVIPLTLNFCLPGEFCIQDQSQIDGSATVRIVYSRARNTVDVYADFVGLPYRPTYEKRFDDSTDFNPQFMRVEDARWQMWLMGTVFGRYHETLYYDATTLQFLGTRFDFAPHGDRPFPAEGTYFTAPAPAIRMVCSPIFEGNPDGTGHLHFTLRFDRIEDAAGSQGVVNTIHPFDICEPDALTNYWTQTRLPDDMFMSFDYFLESIWNGEGIGIAMSAEPYPKPPELAYRDNTFITWGNMYPSVVPQGYGLDFRNFGTITPISGVSEQLDPWPPSRRHLCGSGS